MGDTKIQWTNKSWNPLAAYYGGKRGWMCSKPSPGCKNCYSEAMNVRLGNGLRYTSENVKNIEWKLVNLDEPALWRKPQLVFVESMGDIFHESLPDEVFDQIWRVMESNQHHLFQVLTKRAERMRDYHSARWQIGHDDQCLHPLPNVICGVSVENQEWADKRREAFRDVQSHMKFVSYEPAIGSVDWAGWEFVNQIVSGGESGTGARPSDFAWHEQTRDFC